MWTQRNNILHQDGKAIHSHELNAINSAIISELQRGKETLPSIHHHLFNCDIRERLKDNNNLKQMWLASVWSARDAHNNISNEQSLRNPTALDFYTRWQKRVGEATRTE